MNWREWPDGAEEYTDNAGHYPTANECPVCHTSLRPVEVYYIAREYDGYSEQFTAYYTAICPHCRTKYDRCAPRESVTISPDAETITELEERVRILEDTLSRLITWIRTQTQEQPKAIQAKPKPQESHDDAEDFTRRYRHLL